MLCGRVIASSGWLMARSRGVAKECQRPGRADRREDWCRKRSVAAARTRSRDRREREADRSQGGMPPFRYSCTCTEPAPNVGVRLLRDRRT